MSTLLCNEFREFKSKTLAPARDIDVLESGISEVSIREALI